MLDIAAEINLSETAFVTPLLETDSNADAFLADGCFSLRWFTPTLEVALCGHATLAAAHVLFSRGNPRTTIVFRTLSGDLAVSRMEDGRVSMRFPLNTPSEVVAWRLVPHVCAIVGLAVGEACVSLVHSVWYDPTTRKLVIRLRAWTDFSPSVGLIMGVHQPADSAVQIRGVSVTAVPAPTDPNSHSAHFYSRYFSPWNGIDEDPVNGSSHTVLGPLWAAELGLHTLRAVQASRRRGLLDLVVVVADGANESPHVVISGRVAPTFSGQLLCGNTV